MKVLFLTREYPPYVYGGAGVHVEYLSGELAKLMHVEVRSFGDQDTVREGVRVRGFPFGKGSFAHVDKKLSGALDTFETNLETLSEQVDADLVHVHTWYAPRCFRQDCRYRHSAGRSPWRLSGRSPES